MYKVLIGSKYADELLEKINSAKNSIFIIMYDWRFYVDNPSHLISLINQSLYRAVSRGVDVKAIVNNETIKLNLDKIKIKSKFVNSSRVLHSKVVIIDNKILFIGSHNLTSNAVNNNLESSILVDIPDGDTRIIDYFNNLYNTN